MKKTTDTLWKTMVLLLGIGFIWCLSLPYFMLSNADQDIISVATINRLGRDGNVGEGTAEAHGPPALKDYKEELQSVQIHMEAEKVKGQLKDEMIKEMHLNKIQLQQHVAHMEELLKLQLEKEEKKIQQLKSGKITN
ncbi:hypothetical protein NQZ68_038412 [Dissostichus eleginoides]|nr:hypothetical protein NQZ68_038412 [Dissostichus eleginoides]